MHNVNLQTHIPRSGTTRLWKPDLWLQKIWERERQEQQQQESSTSASTATCTSTSTATRNSNHLQRGNGCTVAVAGEGGGRSQKGIATNNVANFSTNKRELCFL